MGSESFETKVIGTLEYCDDDVEDSPGNDEDGVDDDYDGDADNDDL